MPVWVASLVSLAAGADAEGRWEIIKRAGKAGIFIVRSHIFAGTGGRVPPPMALALGFSPCAASVRLRLTVLF